MFDKPIDFELLNKLIASPKPLSTWMIAEQMIKEKKQPETTLKKLDIFCRYRLEVMRKNGVVRRIRVKKDVENGIPRSYRGYIISQERTLCLNGALLIILEQAILVGCGFHNTSCKTKTCRLERCMLFNTLPENIKQAIQAILDALDELHNSQEAGQEHPKPIAVPVSSTS